MAIYFLKLKHFSLVLVSDTGHLVLNWKLKHLSLVLVSETGHLVNTVRHNVILFYIRTKMQDTQRNVK